MMHRGTTCDTSYAASNAASATVPNKWSIHAWSTNPFASTFHLSGQVTMSLFTTTIGGAAGRGVVCASLVDRQIVNGVRQDRALGSFVYDLASWPTSPRRLTFTFDLSQAQDIAAGHRLVLVLQARVRVRQRPRAPLRPSALPIAARGCDLDAAGAAIGEVIMGFRNIRLRDEHGIALPLALAVLAIVTVLALAAAAAAVTASHQSFRDRNAKRAFQAAAAGVHTANYRTTLLQPGLQQCVIKDPSTGDLSVGPVQADGWCAPQTESLDDGATYTQQVSAGTLVVANGQQLMQREIVSTGLVNGVTRRVDVQDERRHRRAALPCGLRGRQPRFRELREHRDDQRQPRLER